MGSISDAIGLLGGMGNAIGGNFSNNAGWMQQWTTGTTAASSTNCLLDYGTVFGSPEPAAATPAKRSKKKPASGSALEWLDQRVNEIRVAL